MRLRGYVIVSLLVGVAGLAACGPGASTPAATSAPVTATTAPSTATQAPTATPANTATPPPTGTLAPTPTPTSAVPGDPAAGAKLFASLPCSSCHDVTHPFPGGLVAPNLGNIATEAAQIVTSPDYHGHATDAAGYIRESIVDPNAYIVPGSNYHEPDGSSDMEKDFAQKLTPQQIDDLVAYLMTLK